ncbi:MAG: hypothetical protein RLZ28_150 [Actinomycetota bacterium]
MKSSRLNLFIALVLAIAAGVAVFVYTNSAKSVVQSTQQVQEVLVAKQVIPIGTNLADAVSQGLVSTDKYPTGTLPAGFLTKEVANGENAKLSVAQISIAKGMILSSSNFTTTSEAKPNLGPLQVPSGLFAVAVSTADADHVGGFIVPGLSVAVFCTVDQGAGGKADGTPSSTIETTRTRLLVDKATVIGVGNASSVAAANANATANKNSNGLITLAANQSNTQKIIECTRVGQISLALLGSDTVATPDEGVSGSELFEN